MKQKNLAKAAQVLGRIKTKKKAAASSRNGKLSARKKNG
jgi:hypothetical protein